MKIKFNQNIPIYLQIMDGIKREIATGRLKGGDRLASVREMAEELKVNPNTIQRAYQELERENATYTQRGMGTFVATDSKMIADIKKEMSKGMIQNFVSGMRDLGFKDNEIVKVIDDYMLKEDKK